MYGMEIGTIHGMTIDGSSAGASVTAQVDVDSGVRRGPWSVEEDLTLVNSIAIHGEGRWNSLARSAGLKRTGKSCRLRWLNYLRPNVRRGNFTLEEELLILQLHCHWGNRWSKIAQHLPGRTDNEIKNYWRTRVQKHAKQLKFDINSQQFKDAMRHLWIPRLTERIQAASNKTGASSASTSNTAGGCAGYDVHTGSTVVADTKVDTGMGALDPIQHAAAGLLDHLAHVSLQPNDHSNKLGRLSDSLFGASSLWSPQTSNFTADCYGVQRCITFEHCNKFAAGDTMIKGADSCSSYSPLNPGDGYFCGSQILPELEQLSGWETAGGFSSDSLWGFDDVWCFQQAGADANYEGYIDDLRPV